MTATFEPRAAIPSRRAVLAAAIGGIGAWAVSAAGRVRPVRAGGEAITVGGDYITATSATHLENQANGNDVLQVVSASSGTAINGSTSSGVAIIGTSNTYTGIRGASSTHYGVEGQSNANNGVAGSSASASGVYGYSGAGSGVYAYSLASASAASLGWAAGNSTGVLGSSGAGMPPLPKTKTGVYGYAAQDKDARGVFGESTNGRAVQGSVSSSTGYAGYFSGRVFTNRFYEMTEIANPTAPAANRARLFVRDNGSGKTQLCIRYATGGVQVLNTQP